MVRVAVFLPSALDRAAEVAAAQANLTKRQLFEDALRSYLGMDATNQPAAL